MSRSPVFRAVAHCFRTLSLVVIDLVRLASLAAHSRGALAAENLFLRKQLVLFQEREVKPRRTDNSARWMMATLSRMFPWGNGLVNVEAVRSSDGSAKDFGCFGAGSPNQREGLACPRTSGSWSGKMASDNPIWGEERIANELKLKLGIRVSSRTVGKYLRDGPVGTSVLGGLHHEYHLVMEAA